MKWRRTHSLTMILVFKIIFYSFFVLPLRLLFFLAYYFVVFFRTWTAEHWYRCWIMLRTILWVHRATDCIRQRQKSSFFFQRCYWIAFSLAIWIALHTDRKEVSLRYIFTYVWRCEYFNEKSYSYFIVCAWRLRNEKTICVTFKSSLSSYQRVWEAMLVAASFWMMLC